MLMCLPADHIRNHSSGLAQMCLSNMNAGKNLWGKKKEEKKKKGGAPSKRKFFLPIAAAAAPLFSLCFGLKSTSLTQNSKSW